MKKIRLFFLIAVLSLSLMGVAYGEWSQLIKVSSTVKTGEFAGTVEYTSDMVDGVNDVTTTTSAEFEESHLVQVTRTGVTESSDGQVTVEDYVTFINEGSIPARFTEFIPLSATLTADVSVGRYEDSDGDGVLEKTGGFQSTQSLDADIYLKLSIPTEGVIKSSMSDVGRYLNIEGVVVNPDSSLSFQVVEHLVGLVTLNMSVNDILDSEGIQMEEGIEYRIDGYSYDWTYSYYVKQILFNR